MKKKRLYRLLLIAGTLVLLGAVLSIPFHKWARNHVNDMTAATDHPINCASCHLYLKRESFFTKVLSKNYLSPFSLAVSRDGKKLYVIAQDKNELLVLDAVSHKITGRIKTGNHPYGVILDRDEKYCYISNQWSDNVMVADLATLAVTDTLPTGNGPAGLALSQDGRSLFVANSFFSNISVIDLPSGQERKRLNAGNSPVGVQVTPDGSSVFVTSRRALIAPYGTPLETELTLVDANSQLVTGHKNIESAYLMENVAFTPSGDLAMISLIRPKNLVPSIQVERGWMMTDGVCIIERKPGGRTVQLLIDEPNAYYSDPHDIVISPDGKKAFISSSAVNCVSVLSIDSIRKLLDTSSTEALRGYANNLGISSRFVTARIATGADPKGMAVSPDGKLLYVAEMLDDKIAVINTETDQVVGRIDLGGPRKITMARAGRRLLNNAGHTFQNQYSCFTCHPDAHEDGLVYNMASKDMGRNVTNTQSLRNISDTPPYKWNGKNSTVYRQDGMRFSTVLTRTEAFNYRDLDAITAYILTGIPNPPDLQYNPNGILTDAQERGKAIFERKVDSKGFEIPVVNRCVTCHPAPYFTNRKQADVGTLAATDDSILFDTPHLNNIFASPPYLHDGRALTLEEIWTLYGKTEQHGVVNDLTKTQLNDLIEYLKSLRDVEYEKQATKIHQASMSN
jgi:YVTN family beta-propeller protein